MAKNQQGTGGGTATHAGTNYQNRVAAWSSVQILAEQDAVPCWELPASVTLESLHAETAHAVDDIAVQTSVGGSILSQAKHRLTLQTTPDSPLGKAVSQFVREYRAAKPPLDAVKDRLVIVTSSLSSAPIKTHLSAFVKRIRSSPAPDQEWTAGNKEENEAAAVLRDHIIQSWRAESGGDPSPLDILNIVRLARIQILDVDDGGHSEREAKQLLRTSILADPNATDAAWNTLITATAGYAVKGQRADRAALQRAVTDAGIEIKAQRSFHADIGRLREHTAATLRGLIEFSRIQIGGQNIVISRGAVADLRAAAEDGHLLVLGVPGAGKSGALYELAHELDGRGGDVVLFAVDQIEAASTGALRSELNLKHELLSVLAAWPGTKPGYLIIDALDAARSDGAIKTLQAIMSDVVASESRWHVIASVRKFDLRYNQDLQRLFRGVPASAQYTDGEFSAIRHVNIPVLADGELAQIKAQSGALWALVSAANPSLQELLHLPFNLRLLAELLDSGISAAELQPVRTQVELLDRYWRERIIRHDSEGDARELVLRRVTSKMVARRALRVARSAAIGNDAASGAFLDDLLSTHVLAEWTTQTGSAQRDFLTFPHHLLFDYAVARLYVPPDAADLVNLLAGEPDLLIAIRPSIELHFQRLWHYDQASFWDLTFRCLESQINEVGRLLGPSVAALHATVVSQTQPFLDCLKDPARLATGMAGLRHVLATLLTYGTTTGSIRPGPWIEFMEAATADLTPALAGSARPYVVFLSENAAGLEDTDRNRVGAIARRLLRFAVTGVPPNWLLAVNCINAVAKTVATDPADSITGLRLCITDDHLESYGYRTLSALARQVPTLVSIDPGFIRDLYVAGFAHSDQSDEMTMMGDSQIMPLSSNRKQDYGSGLWSLAENYAGFVSTAPREALDALLKVIDSYVRNRRDTENSAVPVVFDGQQSGMVPDYSFIWSSSVSPLHDDPVRMLQAFQSYLERQIDDDLIQQLVQDIAGERPPAIVWRMVLTSGTSHPATIGHAVRSLAWDHYILTERDTTSLAGEFLDAIYPMLDEGERARVEQTIMAIPVLAPQNLNAANRARDRLLGCLDRTRLTTPEAIAHREALDSAGGPPENRPDPKIEVTHAAFDHEKYLRERGVPLDDPEHARLRAIMRPLGEFRSEFLNGVPAPDRIDAILPSMRALNDETDALHRVHAELRNQALIDLVNVCGEILRSDEFEWNAETLVFIRNVLMRALGPATPGPEAEPDEDRETISLGSVRGQAAWALMLLARRGADIAEELKPTIIRLAGDPVASVRFQVAHHLNCLYKTAPDLMWQLLEQFSVKEQHTEVLQGTLNVLQRCAGLDYPRIARLALNIFERAPAEGPHVNEMRGQCSNIFISLAVWHEEPVSSEVIERMIASPSQYAHDLRHVVFDLSRWFKDDDAETRTRAFTMLERILDAQIAAMRTMETQFSGLMFDSWPETERKQYGEVVRTTDEVAMRLHLSSGASSADKASPLPVDPDFYAHAQPLLKKLAAMWHPHTAHSVIETLVYFAPLDPVGVLLMIAEVVKASSAQGYQYEQLGEDLIVRMVERYLAEYRPILREHRECHAALMEILDVFVRVGWPRAHQLTYRLGEIYR